jgi:hypothetical protein
MPHADLPSTPLGWLVALVASMLGFLVGFVFLSLVAKLDGGQ